MAHQVLALGVDVAVVEIDEHHLGLNDVLGLGLARGGDGAGHDVERHAGIGRPIGLHRRLGGELGVGLDERGVRRPVGGALLGQARIGTQPSQ